MLVCVREWPTAYGPLSRSPQITKKKERAELYARAKRSVCKGKRRTRIQMQVEQKEKEEAENCIVVVDSLLV